MQASGQGRDGAMAALIGLDDARLPELVAGASQHGVFVVANRNAPGQVVVSGERPAIEAGAELARTLGAKRAIVLPVSVAAHSPLMAEAAEGMRAAISGIAFSDPEVALLANADARPIETAEACRTELVEHLTAGVDWIRIVEQMAPRVTTLSRSARARPHRPDQANRADAEALRRRPNAPDGSPSPPSCLTTPPTTRRNTARAQLDTPDAPPYRPRRHQPRRQ
jgi:acyl transferase domain-containing protein